jgi:hypothetical protein
MPRLFAASLLFAISATAEWHIPDAQFRFAVSAESADVARVVLHPCAADSATLRPRVFNAAGDALGAFILGQAQGDPMELIFDASSTGPYAVYLVSEDHKSPSPRWLPNGGFLVLTKNLSEAVTIDSHEAFLSHWKAASLSDGSLRREVRNAFPFHAPLDPYQGSFAQPGAPTALHRHSAVLRVSAPKLERIDGLKQQRIDAVAHLQEIQAARSEQVAQVEQLKADDAGKTRIGIAARKLEQLTKVDLPKAEANAKFLAHAAHEVRENLFEFFTVSTGPSFILIDGQLVASSLNKSQGTGVMVDRPGRRKQRTQMFGAQLPLTPGLHRIDYLYAASGAAHDAILSWRPPAVRSADIISSQVGHFVTAKVTKSERRGGGLHFSWWITDDLRVTGAPDLIDVRFSASGPEDGDYHWDFGDGTQATGQSVQHLFLATGDYQVTLNKQVSHRIFAHPIWANLRLAELGGYDTRLAARDFSRQPIAHVWNAYQFVRAVSPPRTSLHRWRSASTRALVARIEEWQKPQRDAVMRIAADAEHHTVNEYEGAKAVYALAIQLSKPGDQVHSDASLALASLRLNVDGDPEGAIALLTAIKSKEQAPRLVLHAEALLALKRLDEADAMLPRETAGELRGIQQRATLRHVRTLIRQPEYLDEAHAELRKLVLADPRLVLDPQVCLMRIDLHLARGELKHAFHLGNRIQNLQLNEVDKPKVMGKQVEALAAVGLLVEARAVLAKLQKAYPYNTALAVARAAMQAASE